MAVDDAPPPPGVKGVRRVPPIPPRPVNDRHVLMRLPRRPVSKDANTIVLPDVDLVGDMISILAVTAGTMHRLDGYG